MMQISQGTKYKTAVFLSLMLLLSLKTVAYGHAELVTASPKPGEIVRNPIGYIQLTFSEPISSSSEILLFEDDFQPVPGINNEFNPAEPTILKATIPDLEPGTYTVQYTAVSEDGHEIEGSYAFQVSATNLPLSGQQLWAFVLAVLLLAAIVVLWRRSGKF